LPTTENRTVRPDNRPDWLKRKHAGPGPVTADRDWADQAIPKLITVIGAGPRRIAFPEGTTPERAHKLRQALYDAAYKGHNRRVPLAEQISLSAHVSDPHTGRCKKCDQLGCKPTPGRLTLHLRVEPKQAGRAHQATVPRDEWDYDPLAPKPRQRAEDTGQEPRRMFGTGTRGPVEPDPPPSRERGAPPPRPEPKPAKDAKTAPAADEGMAAKLRRWTS
jgi:hypothetical protein